MFQILKPTFGEISNFKPTFEGQNLIYVYTGSQHILKVGPVILYNARDFIRIEWDSLLYFGHGWALVLISKVVLSWVFMHYCPSDRTRAL